MSLGKQDGAARLLPNCPEAWASLVPEGFLSFCAWKAARDGQRWPLGTSLSWWLLFLLCPRVCSSRGQQRICTLKKNRRKAVEKRNPGICGNLLGKSEFTRRVLLAPCPLCTWLSAAVQPFLTLFDGLGWLTCHAYIVMLLFCSIWLFLIKKYCLFALAVLFVGLVRHFLAEVFIQPLVFFLRGGVGWSKPVSMLVIHEGLWKAWARVSTDGNHQLPPLPKARL